MRPISHVMTVLLLALSGCARPWQYEGGDMNAFTTTDPSSDFALATHDLYATFTYVTFVIFVVVFAILGFTLVRFRDDGSKGNPEQIHGNMQMEIMWTLAPVAIVLVLIVPTIRTIFEIADTAPSDAVEIKVIGKRWWWAFEYVESGVTTANEMHIPAGSPVSLLITSDSVIHSFWTPRLGGKRDAVPGRINRIWFTVTDEIAKGQPEEYRGLCAEYCGEAHALMRYSVIAHEQSDFDAWLKNMQTPVDMSSASADAKKGKEVFSSGGCIGCHVIEGNDAAKGLQGPDLTRFGDRKWLAAGTDPNTPENLAQWIKDPNSVKPGTTKEANPSRALDGMNIPVDLTDEQVQQLVAYLMAQKSE